MSATQPSWRAWGAVAGGTAVNLCLGILYAWSIWKSVLLGTDQTPGSPMTGLNEGWTYLNSSEANWAYSICGFVFALSMIPGGRLQDRFGPRIGATLGGLFLAGGCVLAGLMHNFTGLVIGFGVLGGIGMGFGYAAATPAAVKWFGPRKRGLVVGIVVSGFGAASVYIAPLARELIRVYGLSGSFIGLGAIFAAVILISAALLKVPPAGYVAPAAAANDTRATLRNWSSAEMLRKPQFYALFWMFFASAQSGLVIIGNATNMLKEAAVGNAWILENISIGAIFIGVINALGRVGTGLYSDKTGRRNAYLINALPTCGAILALTWAIEQKNIPVFFTTIGFIAWQYGGGLAILPALTADFFGAKNLGMNYGLVFLGWGAAFFVPQLAATLNDRAASMWISTGLLASGILVAVFLRKPNDEVVVPSPS